VISSTVLRLVMAASALAAASPALSLEVPRVDLKRPLNYSRPALPAHYDAQVLAERNTPRDNPVTDRGATLGRVLFYDKTLSVDDSVACASCHQPQNGFADPSAFSTGVFGQVGGAHAMRIPNVAFYRGNAMFWDKRAPTLEAQATQPIQNPVEMGFGPSAGGINALLVKMQNSPYYPELFRQVYGDPAITEGRIQKAIAQFERSMISASSRWDQGYARTYNPRLPDKGLSLPIPTFSASENQGLQLFMKAPRDGGAGCAACHRPPSFALAANSLSNGLDAGETRIFKSPSLKASIDGQPMMHDGRYTTFAEVVNHYDAEVADGPALDQRLKDRNGVPRRLALSEAQKASLVAFLKTLRDPGPGADPRFSNPFVTR